MEGELLILPGIKLQKFLGPKIEIFKWLQNYVNVSEFGQFFFLNYKKVSFELYKNFRL